jgi:hypothetical protein
MASYQDFQTVDQDTARGQNDIYQQVVNQTDVNIDEPQQPEHKAKFWHEAAAAGGGFEAVKLFEDHQRKEGKPVSHAKAKEILGGFAATAVDRFAETKGEDFFDRETAKRDAKTQAEALYDQNYGSQDQYDPDQQPPHPDFAPDGYQS